MHPKIPVSVLVAPLDWGLGHATRCIPIIQELIRQGAHVRIAASGPQKNLLVQAFPDLEFLDLPGYRIRYQRGGMLKWSLLAFIPAILKRIKSENSWLQKIMRSYSIDLVISDNRYGLYHKDLFCVFITHQLALQSGIGKKSVKGGWKSVIREKVESVIIKWNYRLISRFSLCWVPDNEGEFSFAGLLSHSKVKSPFRMEYIGILSRFHYTVKQIVKNSLLILISGPEPQRSDFEKMFLSQLESTGMNIVIVRGLPGSNEPTPMIYSESVTIYNHLCDEDLNKLLLESEYIICRSGYSTMMDLLTLRRHAIIIPTPGQTEQEYLGSYLDEKKWMYTVPEKNFNIGNAVNEFKNISLVLPEIRDSRLPKVVRELIQHAE